MKWKYSSIVLISALIMTSSLSAQRMNMLKLDIDLDKDRYNLQDSICISYTLTAAEAEILKIAKDQCWFRFRIEDEKGKVLVSGKENIFLSRRALPELRMAVLSHDKTIKIGTVLALNLLKSEVFDCTGLKAGRYKIYGVYRFEPEKEPEGAALYLHLAERETLWTGICFSSPVVFELFHGP